jgi:hypothetical protein
LLAACNSMTLETDKTPRLKELLTEPRKKYFVSWPTLSIHYGRSSVKDLCQFCYFVKAGEIVLRLQSRVAYPGEAPVSVIASAAPREQVV